MNNNISTNRFKLFNIEDMDFVYLPESAEILKIQSSEMKAYFDICLSGVNDKMLDDDKVAEITKTLIDNIEIPDLTDNSDPENVTLMINMTTGCNMACKYCFAEVNQGKVQNITLDTIKNAVFDLLEKYIDTPSYTIFFFGGEPLLRRDLMVESVTFIKEIMLEHSKKVNFSVSTNGTLIDSSIIEFFKRESFQVTVSIDGCKVQNKERIFNDGTETFETVINNVKLLKKAGVSLGLHATFSPFTENLLGTIQYFESLQIPYNYDFTIGSIQKSEDNTRFTKDKFSVVKIEIMNIADFLTNKFLNDEHIYCSTFISRLFYVRDKNYKLHGCEAGRGTFIVDEKGNYYPCQNMIPFPNTTIGNTSTGINFQKQMKSQSHSLISIQDCQSCWARFLCGGGCEAERLMKDSTESLHVRCEIIRAEWLSTIIAYTRIREYKYMFNLKTKKNERFEEART